MRTFYLNMDRADTAESVHGKLKTLLSLPDYYGRNLDALNDSLSESKEKGRLWIKGAKEASDAVQSLLAGVEQVFCDNGFSVLRLD